MDENNNNIKDVPYIVFEGELARAERHIKRLWIALIVAIVALLACNIAYLWYLNQYDFESYEITAEGDGHANYIGQDGDIYNGTGPSEEATEKEP
jgi:hypothetical protein